MSYTDLSKMATMQYDTTYGVSGEYLMTIEMNNMFLSGSHPYILSDSRHTDADIKMGDILPESTQIERQNVTTDYHGAIVKGLGYTLYVVITGQRRVTVTAVSNNLEEGAGVVNGIIDRVPMAEPREEAVSLTIWCLTGMGPRPTMKRIVAPNWSQLQQHYPMSVSSALGKLMSQEAPDVEAGKIILWYGPPGTGKTTALRGMAREWRDWCDIQYIADPEKFFADPSYVMQVGGGVDERYLDEVSSPSDENAEQPRWRLIVCEDSDQFLRTTAKSDASAGALGRLLNFSDGILGQGSRTLFLLTTNEKVENLHEAVIRPGRCFAQLKFDKFDVTEANAWLAREGLTNRVQDEMSLAELGEIKGSKRILSNLGDDTPEGLYI